MLKLAKELEQTFYGKTSNLINNPQKEPFIIKALIRLVHCRKRNRNFAAITTLKINKHGMSFILLLFFEICTLFRAENANILVIAQTKN